MHARTLAFLIVLGMVGCARHSCPVYPASSPRPFLWRVTGVHGSLVIQATHQGTGAGDVSDLAWSELAQAEMYVAEAAEPDLDRDRGHDWNAATRAPGPSLRRLIGDRAFDRLSFYLDVTPDQLLSLEPWVAFVLLAREASPPPAPAMTEALFARATQLAMPMQFLDTWDEQVAYLDAAITPSKLRAAIDDYEHLGCRMQYRLGAFRAGTTEMFARELTTSDIEALRRTIRWMRQLRDLINGGAHAFVAVGIGHLVGPYGVLHGLRRYGYRVERL